MKGKWWLPLLCAVLAVGCGKDSEVKTAFYHWKTRFSPSPFENDALAQLHTDRLYVKYFDVDWPEDATSAKPRAKVEWGSTPQAEIVPAVFITNRSMQRTGSEGASALADKIFQLIVDLHPRDAARFREVQMDCDWTASTRAAYFDLLTRLRQRLDSMDVALSATIRLHQIKYPKQTGVPPVDRGMLMFYNMGDLDNPQEENSILDLTIGERYLGKLGEYELPLDVALPIYSWGVLIRRDRPIYLLNNMHMADLEALPWMHKLGAHRMAVDTSHYLGGQYLYPGDEIRVEEVEAKALMGAADMIAQRIAPADRHVAFYHLDSLPLSHFRLTTLDSVAQRFGTGPSAK